MVDSGAVGSEPVAWGLAILEMVDSEPVDLDLLELVMAD